MEGNVTLEKVEGNELYNFAHILEKYEDEFQSEDVLKLSLNCCDYHSPKEIPTLNQAIKNILSVFGINCRGITNNLDNFKGLLCDMSTSTFSFDIIGLTEIHTVVPNINYNLSGYHSPKFKPRQANDDGKGGVGIYVKETINFKMRDDLSIFIPHIIETIFIEMTIDHKNMVCGVIYRPNTLPKADLDIFTTTLFEIVDKITNENKSLLLLGDFNIDLLKYETHNKTNDFVDNLFATGLSPLITKPTRITDHSATLIDHIHTNCMHDVYKSGIVVTDVADHFGIFTFIKTKNIKYDHPTLKQRRITPNNIATFKRLLTDCDFSAVNMSNDVNESYNYFIEIYLSAFNNAFPIESYSRCNKYVKHEPWVSKGFITSSIQKHKLFKKKCNKPTLNHINHYKKYCRVFNLVRRELKSKYYRETLTKYKNNTKETWKLIGQVITKSKSISKLPSSFVINDKVITDPTDIAENFNHFFSNIASNIVENIPQSLNSYRSYLTESHATNFFMNPVVPNDLITSTGMLKPKSSSGYDNISNKILKETINEVVLPLTHIFNLSFINGIIPDKMKTEKIVPVFKSGDAQCLNNYRPISLLPVISKLMEKIVHKRLMNFMVKNNLLYEHQYGFQKKNSTVHPIMQLVKHITDSSDKSSKHFTIGTFLDLSKAFDTVSHSILIDKLEYYGIRGVSLNWFKNYLTNRFQFTEVNGSKSSSTAVQYGVPQGSILGPLLFLIYVNDMAKCTTLKLLSFADDTTLYDSSHNTTTLTTKFNTELQNVYTWLNANKLCLNIAKSKFMVFGPQNSSALSQNFNIHINNIKIEQCGRKGKQTSVKFLGLLLDEHLSWRPQVLSVCNKIKKGIFALNQMKKFMSVDSLTMIYSTLISCHLNYCLELWGNSKSLEKIIKLQKRAIRIIYKESYRAHTEALFKRSGILKIDSLYKLKLLYFAYDSKHKLLPKSFNSFYPHINRPMITRQEHNIDCHRPRTTFSHDSFSHMAVAYWNQLSPDLKQVPSKSIFKKLIKNEIN